MGVELGLYCRKKRITLKGDGIFMKNTTEMTRGREIAFILRRHLFAVLVCFALAIMLFLNLFNITMLRNITGVFLILLYFVLIYAASSEVARIDTRSYTPTTPSVKTAIIYGTIISLLNLVSLVLFKLNWMFFSDGVGMTNGYSIAYNAVFYFLQSPYLSLLYMQTSGNVSALTIVLMLALPILASVLGYLAGKTDFSFYEKMRRFMFEKNDS